MTENTSRQAQTNPSYLAEFWGNPDINALIPGYYHWEGRALRIYHLTTKQRGILADLVRAHPDAYRSKVAAEFRLRTGRRITLKTVTDTRIRLGIAAPGNPISAGGPPC